MRIPRHKKIIAVFFLVIFSVQLLTPTVSFALTNGPSQPEMAKFEPAGTTDLVDLFSGDMKYNIPLIDVGGYPINISYNSGTGMEDEASWVGAGWTLNPGAVNRTMRGLPDDFDGSKGDKIDKEFSKKQFKKVGAQIVVKPSAFAWEFGSASLKLNVYKDNYYGIGASVGAGVNFSLSKNNNSSLTAGLNLDVNSDVRNGVDISPGFTLTSNYEHNKDVSGSASLSGGFTYNTRGGLRNVSLGASFSTTTTYKDDKQFTSSFDQSAVHYFGQSYTPSINNNTANTGFTFSLDLGPSIFGGYFGLGGSGYVYQERNLEPSVSVPAFGYMNYHKGRKNEGALLDFNREKDGVFITSAPAIAVPVATNDFFTATGQTGSQQFRPNFGGNYVVFDKIHSNTNDNTSIGLTIGGGNVFKGGGRVDLTNGGTTTKKWTSNNLYLNKAEAAVSTNVDAEPVYFKQVGEKTAADRSFYDQFDYTNTGKVTVTGHKSTGPLASASLKTRTAPFPLPDIKKTNREKKNYGFSYLTTDQAQRYALDKLLKSHDANPASFTSIPRNTGGRQAHHISEVTVTDNEGKRMVYGIPVNNLYQEEATFDITAPTDANELEKARRTGLVNYNATDASPANTNGRFNTYSKEKIPSYTTSYLLTGILSPDYVDLTDDGITDDDPGTSVKFNYTKITTDVNPYHWRAPYVSMKANFNEGFLSDKKDDKGNYVYGKKEIWYLNSVESKTMIAIFETSDRADGRGVAGPNGGMGSLNVKKLDRIKLYSKADWVKNPSTAVPIKVVHFVYDYSLYPGVHNNTGSPAMGPDPDNPANPYPWPGGSPVEVNVAKGKGKLTLRMIFFTFGSGNRGKSNPYQFYYDMRPLNDGTIPGLPSIPGNDEEYNDAYLERQTDRWGTYKKSFYNHNVSGTRTLNNSEFPYSLQQNEHTGLNDRILADRLASKWQLNKIITPSSGIITIEYESDDYYYVQNRKAMQMCIIKGVTNNGQQHDLINSDRFVVELPKSVSGSEEFKKLYLTDAEGRRVDKIFYKVLTDINAQGKYEYVHGYAEIDVNASTASGNTATIMIKKIKEVNPVSRAGWQMLKTDLPQYAYDGYDNSDATNFAGDLKAIIRSIIFSIGNLTEVIRGFESKAKNRKFADVVTLNKSMVRLYSPGIVSSIDDKATDFRKTGGGARVVKVQITDEWTAMTNGTGSNTAKYGQRYDYTIKNKDNQLISSGVASYEPGIGNEENPFHEPINFTETVHWSADRNHFIEKPFCESYFPAASVGYSKVTVTSFGDDYPGSGQVNPKPTGYIENEFYTARDFPTIVDYLTLDQTNYENSMLLKLFTSTSINRVSTSQGFKVELNDMHGKPKSVRIYNKSGDLNSSTEYYYRVKDEKAEVKELDNDNVAVLQTGTGGSGTITPATMATEIDFTTDVRESNSESVGTSIGAYTGGLVIPFIVPIYVPYLAVNFNRSRTFDTYNSVSAVKVINRFGLVSKVVTTQNGSTIEAQNLLWDALTGEVLLTRTQNEYDKSTFAFNYPAHMVSALEGMAGAYKNLGITFTSFTTGTNGKMSTTNMAYLFPGDELVNLGQTDQRGWIIKGPSPTPSDPDYRLIDDKGNFISTTGSWLVLRSGRRNLLAAGVGSVITMRDPRVGNQIMLNVDRKILDSKSIDFKDEWPVPVNNINSTGNDSTCNNTGCIGSSGGNFFMASLRKIVEQNGTYTRRGIFTWSSDNLTAGDIMTGECSHTPCMCNFLDNQPPSAFPYYMQNQRYNSSTNQFYINVGDAANLGGYNIVYDNIHPDFITLANLPLSEGGMALELGAISCQWNSGLFVGSAFKYCLIKESDCGYVLRRTNPCNIPNNTPIESDCSQYASSYEGYATFTDLVRFHVVTPPVNICIDPVGQPINPYYKGILGNWRPLMNYVYTVNREQIPGNPNQLGGTDIRNSGNYKTYSPFWLFQATNKLSKDVNAQGEPNDNRWVWSNKSVYYDQKGNEIESVDALNRFGAALFGYRQSVAVAVGANARNNELAFDGFEDYDFDLANNLNETCPLKRHFDFGFVKNESVWTSPGGTISAEKSHTGKNSFKLSGTSSVTKNAGNAAPAAGSVLSYDGTGRYLLNANELAYGFAPINGKKYLFSCWVYDNNPFTNTLNGVTISVNGQSPTGVTVVEGWKRIEIPFIASPTFTLNMTGSEVYIDDIRLLPFDGQMNSYVYDNRTMRLMAQLDENNFATLYEYDDEGTPVRVKKETERGIMTLKENRQALRKRN